MGKGTITRPTRAGPPNGRIDTTAELVAAITPRHRARENARGQTARRRMRGALTPRLARDARCGRSIAAPFTLLLPVPRHAATGRARTRVGTDVVRGLLFRGRREGATASTHRTRARRRATPAPGGTPRAWRACAGRCALRHDGLGAHGGCGGGASTEGPGLAVGTARGEGWTRKR